MLPCGSNCSAGIDTLIKTNKQTLLKIFINCLCRWAARSKQVKRMFPKEQNMCFKGITLSLNTSRKTQSKCIFCRSVCFHWRSNNKKQPHKQTNKQTPASAIDFNYDFQLLKNLNVSYVYFGKYLITICIQSIIYATLCILKYWI